MSELSKVEALLFGGGAVAYSDELFSPVAVPTMEEAVETSPPGKVTLSLHEMCSVYSETYFSCGSRQQSGPNLLPQSNNTLELRSLLCIPPPPLELCFAFSFPQTEQYVHRNADVLTLCGVVLQKNCS